MTAAARLVIDHKDRVRYQPYIHTGAIAHPDLVLVNPGTMMLKAWRQYNRPQAGDIPVTYRSKGRAIRQAEKEIARRTS